MKKMMKWASVAGRVLCIGLIASIFVRAASALPLISIQANAPESLIIYGSDFREFGRRQAAGYWSQHTLTLWDKHGDYAYFSCDAEKNDPPSGDWDVPDVGQDWDLFYDRAAEILRKCEWAPYITSNNIDYQNLATMRINYKSLNRNDELSLGVDFYDIPIVTKPPVSCTSDVERDINFGSVSLSATSVPVSASGTVRTVCDHAALISVSVNGGSGLNNIDGSEILFDYPRTFELESGVVGMTNIHAMLSRPPGRPGAYKWYAPVIIEYH